jgi:hypothetical protein
VIDSQSVRTTEAGDPCGYDAGKKIKGRKRHIMVDTAGRPLVLRSHSTGIQGRDGAVPTLQASRKRFPFIEKVFADSGYAGERVAKATCITPEIIRKPKDQTGLAVQSRRWMVRLAEPQPQARQGLRAHHRFRRGLPLRRFRHAPRQAPRSFCMSFQPDTKAL